MAELEMDRGEDRDITFTFDGETEFDPADVVWFTAKDSFSDTDAQAVIARTSSDGGITLVGGTATARINAADTAGLTTNTRLFYDWQILTAAGRVRTLDKGTIDVAADVTRATTTPAP